MVVRTWHPTAKKIFAFSFCWLCLSSIDLVPQVAAQEHDHPVPEKLGTVSFPISCSPRTQKEFNRAVALLHSFAYSAAEKAFRELIDKDPDCAMAHWGLAMTWVHPLWDPYLLAEDAIRGQQEIERAAKIGGSERERGFIDALGELYVKADSVPWSERIHVYTVAMGKLAERNPNDVECQVFYALALISSASPTDKTHADEKKAVDLLEPLFQKYPKHPGIPHYLIHACDNSKMASRGLVAARKYSQIAPSAPHALHMPSHIHTRLGMWKESVASNLAARNAAHDQGDVGEELHAMDYLTYAYLQLGRDAEAARILKDLGAMSDLNSSEFKVGYAATAMPVRYAIERKQWPEATKIVPISGTQPQVSAVTAWARAIGFSRGGDPVAAKSELAKLQTAYEQLHSAANDYWAEQVKVQINEVLGWIGYAEKRYDDAIKLMRNAADDEDAVEKRPVTPGAIVPAREQLGDLLLQLNRPEEALREFESALVMTPGRRGAVAGKARAGEMIRANEAR